MKNIQYMLTIVSASFIMFMAGCQTYDSTSVSNRDINQLSTVYTGVIESAQEVTIRPDGSIIGTATGAILGGLGGSEFGGGDKEKTAGGIAGAVLGAAVGNQIGKAANTQKGYSYIVKITETGERREITQGGDVYYQPGTRVNIVYRQSGVTLTPASYSPSSSLAASNTACSLQGLNVYTPQTLSNTGYYSSGNNTNRGYATRSVTSGCWRNTQPTPTYSTSPYTSSVGTTTYTRGTTTRGVNY